VDEKPVSAASSALHSCPYQAIEYLEDKGKARVNEALCKGCGTCVGTCLPKSSVSSTSPTNNWWPK
jgi:heterodisulfide reductase subunit A2